jgi:tyrosyl-tRNA synthetase
MAKVREMKGEECLARPEERTHHTIFQYWLNVADADAPKLLRLFTLLPKEEIGRLETEHEAAPEERIMQKALARDVTTRVHSEADYSAAVEASEILFGKGTTESLRRLSEEDFLALFEGVPQAAVSRPEFDAGITLLDLVTDKTKMFPSKGEARRMFQQGGYRLTKTKLLTRQKNRLLKCCSITDIFFFSGERRIISLSKWSKTAIRHPELTY